MNPHQPDDSDMDQWVNRDYYFETAEALHTLPPLPRLNNIGPSGIHLSQDNRSSRTVPLKRELEPTPDWPKRQKKNDQTASDTHTGVPGSYFRRIEPPYQVEGYPFPDYPYNWAGAAFPSTQTDSYHDNTWHQPTPPSTNLEARETSSPSTVERYQFNGPIHSAAPDRPCFTHAQASYRPPQNIKPDKAFPQAEFRYVNDKPQLSLQFGLSIPTADQNHSLVMKRHSHFTPSQDSHDQAPDDLQTSPSNNFLFKLLDTEEDDYFVGDSDEEEMAQLTDQSSTDAHQIPPSSVIRDMDADSTIEVFDPSLQRSSPRSGPEYGDDGTRKDEPHFQDEDLLSSEVDWDMVFESGPSQSKAISSRDTGLQARPTVGNKTLTTGIRTGSFRSSGTSIKIQSSLPRLPPPSPAMGKTTSTIISNTSKMRTFFRVGELVNEGKRCFYRKNQATFELYAWVTDSWREENSSKVQHFQFMDLFKEQRLDLRGTLSGWRTGEVLDVQSSAFLYTDNRANSKLCRCVCRVFPDHKVGMGWVLGVIWIRQATWEEVSGKEGFTTPTW